MKIAGNIVETGKKISAMNTEQLKGRILRKPVTDSKVYIINYLTKSNKKPVDKG